jgi:rRNA maturation protein Nop10
LQWVSELLAVSLMAGAYGSSIFIWFRSWKIRRNYIKVACPGCGGHIEFPKNAGNCKIACPHCGGGVRLQYLPKIE